MELTYSNYLQDTQVKRKYNMSHVEYMEGLIDNLISQQNKNSTNEQDNYTTVMNPASSDVLPSGSIVQPPLASHLNELSPVVKQDINDKDKKLFFLGGGGGGGGGHDNTDFIFIGPDSPLPISMTFIVIWRTIRETGMPKYRMARFPIESGLNIDAWAKYLKDYSNKKLLQYLTYGFPLSIINPDSLGNKNITNRFSALQFPGAVD